MDCLEAQALISEALDRAPVDAAALESAKAHCRECVECGNFVRTLAAIQRAPLPEPPEDLADRVMDALTIDVARARAEARKTPVRAASDANALPSDAPVSLERLTQRMSDPRTRRQLAVWASAAAVVFVAAGALAVSGVRQILVPPVESREVATFDASSEQGTLGQPPAATQLAPAPSAGTQAPSGSGAESVVQAPDYAVFDGTVYRSGGPAVGIDPTAMTSLGSATTALGTGQAATSREVIGNRGDLSRIYVAAEEPGTYLLFDRVVRTYEGRVYALRSDAVEGFGEWPSLPSDIQTPMREDGTPTFTLVTEGVYRLSSADVDRGIAIAPNASATDAAAGNPNWTWWVPLP